MNKIQWNLNRNSCISIHENVIENVVWKMVTILSRFQYVNTMRFEPNDWNITIHVQRKIRMELTKFKKRYLCMYIF